MTKSINTNDILSMLEAGVPASDIATQLSSALEEAKAIHKENTKTYKCEKELANLASAANDLYKAIFDEEPTGPMQKICAPSPEAIKSVAKELDEISKDTSNKLLLKLGLAVLASEVTKAPIKSTPAMPARDPRPIADTHTLSCIPSFEELTSLDAANFLTPSRTRVKELKNPTPERSYSKANFDMDLDALLKMKNIRK